MHNKLIQKNVLKVVSKRLDPHHSIIQGKSKNCLVCLQKSSKTQQQSPQINLSHNFQVYSFAISNQEMSFSSQPLIPPSKTEEYVEQVRKVVEEQAKQIIKQWCEYLVQYMERQQYFPLKTALAFSNDQSINQNRVIWEQRIDRRLRSNHGDQGKEIIPHFYKKSVELYDESLFRMVCIQAEAIQQLKDVQYNDEFSI